MALIDTWKKMMQKEDFKGLKAKLCQEYLCLHLRAVSNEPFNKAVD